MENITLCKTKAGKGFKVIANGKWFYVNQKYLLEVIDNKRKSCVFNTIERE